MKKNYVLVEVLHFEHDMASVRLPDDRIILIKSEFIREGTISVPTRKPIPHIKKPRTKKDVPDD